MTHLSLRSIIVVVLLLLGLLLVYAPQLLSFTSSTLSAEPAQEGHLYVADLDFWQQTKRERTVTAKARFDLSSDLNNVPLQIADWMGKDVPETNQEVMILLEPEQYVQRLYQDSTGRYIWLSMVGGRSSQPFHAPDICYDSDGWQYDLGSKAVSLDGGGELYGLWLQAHKQMPGQDKPIEHVVFYFYLFPDHRRDLADGIVLFKLTSSHYGTLEETLEMHADFVRQLFTAAS